MVIPTDPKFEGFELLQTPYKTVQGHDIRVDVLVPRTSVTGKRPIIVRFHGGGLVTITLHHPTPTGTNQNIQIIGDSIGWWPHWLSDLALQHEAIMISPNYRLLPGSTSPEIYEDVEDFWKWLHSPELNRLLAQNPTPVEADLDRVLTFGESAGGLLSVYVGLSHPADIRVMTAAYPMLDLNPDPSKSSPKLPLGMHTDKKVLDEGPPPGTVESSILVGERSKYMLAAFEYQTFGQIYARGTDVPVEDAQKFVDRLREVTKGQPGNDKIVLSLQHGEHGFDMDFRLTEPWIQDVFKQAVDSWLA
ncbi:hypothetical protein N7468_005961 [Penicillium chermesinum]|uniref:Alpha/beta hydrolase fold-3 domain-containing protein n=1 Tax=Penicillium chermesinum TaxID=63820 RepID=A0A9W9TNG7_9EURO|nr:uncharacterized protein N7468_005961 [Penicillium chermesinum]KAJ5233005.1 hypothetical protein N7468_005961 [Penicillium chermesinum]